MGFPNHMFDFSKFLGGYGNYPKYSTTKKPLPVARWSTHHAVGAAVLLGEDPSNSLRGGSKSKGPVKSRVWWGDSQPFLSGSRYWGYQTYSRFTFTGLSPPKEQNRNHFFSVSSTSLISQSDHNMATNKPVDDSQIRALEPPSRSPLIEADMFLWHSCQQ